MDLAREAVYDTLRLLPPQASLLYRPSPQVILYRAFS